MEGHTPVEPSDAEHSETQWTYPTRLCRICFEEVVPTVTMYPPGLPPAFQHPVVEYKNDDEYGRLIRPCHCRGGMRYIHELCLMRSRTEGVRPGSLWKCHQCGHGFNFQRLKIQRFLASRAAAGILTVLFIIILVFLLGFVADPIINLYVDPYDTFSRNEYWQTVKLTELDPRGSSWSLHFLKGFLSVSVLGFLKVIALNPWQWWNMRNSGFIGARSRTSTTGQDRAVSISWIAVVIGISSASYLFYQWVQAIVQRSLQHIGNNIVDTKLQGDDDDIKPPSGWKPPSSSDDNQDPEVTSSEIPRDEPETNAHPQTNPLPTEPVSEDALPSKTAAESSSSEYERIHESSASPGVQNPDLGSIHRQTWSFGNI